MKFESLRREAVLRLIANDIRCHGNESTILTAALAEHIRKVVLHRGGSHSLDHHEPVATAVISRIVRQRLAPIWPAIDEPENESTIRKELDELALIDDLVHAPRGWLLSPPRLIPLLDTYFLLIGGSSARDFSPHIRQNMLSFGRTRVLTNTGHSQSWGLPQLSIEEWLSLPYSDLSAWLRTFFRAKTPLMKSIDLDGEVAVYEPHRWVALKDYRQKGTTILFRQNVKIYGNDSQIYYLAQVKRINNGQATIHSGVEIKRNDARRVQLALYKDSSPIIALLTRADDTVSFSLKHPLPFPESRFLSLGISSSVHEGKPWPRKYTFPSQLFPLIASALINIGFYIENRGQVKS